MPENETNFDDEPRRDIPWPGGVRPAVEQPQAPQFVAEELRNEPRDYYAGSDLADGDPNFTGLWPAEGEVETKTFARPFDAPMELPVEIPEMPPSSWPPETQVSAAIEDPQLPPRAWPPDQFGAQAQFVPESYIPEDIDETARRSGLAYSAGIVFFVSVAFLLLLGWIADLLLGTSPFGIVAGIVIGSMIGFVQFFYISKQIYEPSNRKHEIKPFLTGHDDQDDG
ncbi:MAG: AtpZ/AtpI family protein [Pyrinomonadaceae bacterium]